MKKSYSHHLAGKKLAKKKGSHPPRRSNPLIIRVEHIGIEPMTS